MLIVVYVILRIGDIVTTWIGLSVGLSEANPLFTDLPPFIVITILTLSSVITTCFLLVSNDDERYAVVVFVMLLGLDALGFAVIFNNVYYLGKV